MNMLGDLSVFSVENLAFLTTKKQLLFKLLPSLGPFFGPQNLKIFKGIFVACHMG